MDDGPAGFIDDSLGLNRTTSSDVFKSYSLRGPYTHSDTLRRRLVVDEDDDAIQVTSSCGGPDTLYHVVTRRIPPDLQALLSRPLTEQEREQLSHRVDSISAESFPFPHRPKALWLFGPPAAGKSSMADELSIDLFGRPNNAVLVDGDEVREVHEGFQKVAEHGLRNNLVHADAWHIFKQTKIVQHAKKDIFRAAIKARQNLKIPDASMNTERIMSMIGELEQAGYDLYARCIWAPEIETQIRGRSRSVKAGKVFSTANYATACTGALEMGRLWEKKLAEGSECFKAVAFYDNTSRPSHPVHLAQFELLVSMTASEALAHVELCRATRDAHERADVVASKAEACGSAPRAVARLWLREATTTCSVGPLSPTASGGAVGADADDTDADGSRSLPLSVVDRSHSVGMLQLMRSRSNSPVKQVRSGASSAPVASASRSCADDMESLILAERRLGQFQGLLLGILLFSLLQSTTRQRLSCSDC